MIQLNKPTKAREKIIVQVNLRVNAFSSRFLESEYSSKSSISYPMVIWPDFSPSLVAFRHFHGAIRAVLINYDDVAVVDLRFDALQGPFDC